MQKKETIKRIIISRTDAIGDVMLTLPLCGIIKKYLPETKIIFLGNSYTKSVIACCEHVDDFLDVGDLGSKNNNAVERLKGINADVIIHVFPNKAIARLAKKARILKRVGTTNRIFHWGTVNKFIRLSRKSSTLHESQLNCLLLQGIGIDCVPKLSEMAEFIGFTKQPILKKEHALMLDKLKINIILHPKSNASAREWSLDNFKALITLLNPGQHKIFISGTEKEKSLLETWIQSLPSHVVDVTGKFSLEEFIAFISKADCLVAASTGPLHIAAAVGIYAIGVYPPIKPMHPGRWQPIGEKASYLCASKSCSDCRNNPKACHCMNEITAEQVMKRMQKN